MIWIGADDRWIGITGVLTLTHILVVPLFVWHRKYFILRWQVAWWWTTLSATFNVNVRPLPHNPIGWWRGVDNLVESPWLTVKGQISMKIIALCLLLPIFSSVASACLINGNAVNDGLFVTVGNTGKQVGAYAGIRTSSIEACVSACQRETQCAGVTFRNAPRNCLKFSRTDYQTGETKRRFRIFQKQGTSIIVRSQNGSLCANWWDPMKYASAADHKQSSEVGDQTFTTQIAYSIMNLQYLVLILSDLALTHSSTQLSASKSASQSFSWGRQYSALPNMCKPDEHQVWVQCLLD